MESKARSQPAEVQPLDTMFALLSDRRRRHLVSALADRDSPASLAELATEVAAREFDGDPADLPADRIDAVAVTLHHDHVPRLADAGVVTYDAGTKTVTATRIEELSTFLDVTDDDR